MATGQLRDLVDLISRAVDVVEAEYQKTGQPCPSLSDPIRGPLDKADAITPELSTAVKTLQAACFQLIYTAQPPYMSMIMKSTSFTDPALIEFVSETRIANLLENKPEGVHVDILAEQARVSPDKLGRILRMLATGHVFKEVKPNVFANNRISIELISEDEYPSIYSHLASNAKQCSKFTEVLTDPETAHSEDVKDSSFTRVYGVPPFEYYATKASPTEIRVVQKAMAGFSHFRNEHMIPKAYSWDTLPKNSTVCDVGGGVGQIGMQLYMQHPHLRIVIQDLPNVMDHGREFWQGKCPDALEKQAVTFVPLDFFKETPVASCDVYFLSHVLHDWPDAKAKEILSSVRKAMKPESRLIINELVIKSAVRTFGVTDSTVDQAPEPLLPNWGVGGMRPYMQDFVMMTSYNSKERTVDQYRELGDASGLKFVKLWEAGTISLVEFAPA